MQRIVDVYIFNIPTVGSYRPQPLRNRVNIQYIALETTLKHSGSDIISIN